MNYIVTVIITVFLGWSSVFSVPFEELEKAFASGDAEKVMTFSGEKVLITIDKKEGVYSRSQGAQVLKSFFNAHPATSFKFTFKGKEKGTSSFAVGSYSCKENKYRVSIKFVQDKDDYLIEAITLEKD